ncbi:ThiF family adenylyltransferase [Pseudoduganella sp. R-34]|uniref:ThiF family adenylyltransferase n=1 Tax=Pseudoduganella sp. R-34 TaxID=3404062 RepID=UPI003CE86619
MWFQRPDDRLALEQQVIAALVSEGWVKNVAWHIDEVQGTARVDIDLLAGEKWWEAKVVYPFIYPYAPPQVIPREDAKWSSHQWGRGELCLEIRTDNWHPSLTGGDMIHSARKLLETESTLDETGAPLEVACDHRFTEGQYLSWELIRLVLTDELIAEINRRDNVVSLLELARVEYDLSWVFTGIALIGDTNFDAWTDHGVPKQFSTYGVSIGRIAKLEEGDQRHQALTNADCAPADVWQHFSDIPFDSPKVVVGILNSKVLAKFLGKEKVFEVANVPMDNQQRTPVRNDAVIGKRVAIVGCGSMGSKVAASLVRCGVSNFLLIDGDVLKPGNLVRNELDWFAVGAHKVDGVVNRLRAISPKVDVETWKGRLDGHTSTARILTALEKLGQCDLIVETSGSGQGFSVAAAVATQEKIPMVWGRVFGGGYGGYIVRSRPGIEYPALDVRHQLYVAMTDPELPKPPDDSDIDYGSEHDEQAMIADDADVSVISAHLSRMSLDSLRPSDLSDYPESAYLIGLREEWIFEAPFETRAVTLPRIAQESTND